MVFLDIKMLFRGNKNKMIFIWGDYALLTIHVDGLAQLYKLHFSWHVTHGPHQVPQVFTGYETILVFIKLYKSFTQL